MGLLDFLKELFSTKEYGIPSRTIQGELLKSRSEQRIADYFTENGIRYVYEKGAQTDALIFKRTFAKPDFYLPDYNVYVEYWGLIGASKEYERNMKWKMAQYHQNGIKFISLYPKNLGNLDWIFRTKFKAAVGFDLPRKSSDARTSTSCTACRAPIAVGANFCQHCGSRISG